ncbi:prepilin-type N-terminal cleavage/methylation domain-containing protein [Puniceicoccaceae bacterium K14]|nr:prepilin-type N-terminal cleavage/methylation domain-containing protein [Puniceicoccaceae bacterium K14]
MLKHRNQGFSLVEVLLVIALIAMFVGTIVVNVQGMFHRSEINSVEDGFWQAVDKAKQNSVFQQRKYRLFFDEELRAFKIVSGEMEEVFGFDLGPLAEEMHLEVRFTEKMPDNGSKLIGGRRISDREIEKVLFYPDGTCTPFSVTMDISEYSTQYDIDPWTAAPLVPEENRR